MTADMSTELKKREKSVSVISLWPGIVRTEHMQNMAEKAGDRFPFDLENLCKSFTRSPLKEARKKRMYGVLLWAQASHVYRCLLNTRSHCECTRESVKLTLIPKLAVFEL